MTFSSVLKSAGRFVGILIPLAIGVVCGKLMTPHLPQISDWVTKLGVWAPIAFVCIYVLVVMLMFPAFLFTIVGGAVFGIVKGSILIVIASMIGATGAFLVARHVARDFVLRRIAGNPHMRAIDRMVGEDGRKLVFLLRLSGVVPFVASNYVLGVTQVRIGDYVIGTLGIIPTVVAYAAYGSAAGTIAATTSGQSPVPTWVFVVAISATVLLLYFVTRMTRRALAEAGVVDRD